MARTELHPIRVAADDITVLMGCDATLIGHLRRHSANKMRLWVENWRNTEDRFSWALDVAQSGEYDLTALVQAHDGELQVACGRSVCRARGRSEAWDRLPLGRLHLPEGGTQISAQLTQAAQAKLYALEIVPVGFRAVLSERAQRLRASTEWFAKAGYGIFCHWTTRNQPPRGPAKPWPRDVDDLDVVGYAARMQEMGAGYVIFTSSWGPQYFPAPIQAIEELVPGRTSQRDLIADLAEALGAHDIPLLLYYHSGYPCYHAEDEVWWHAMGGYEADKNAFFEHWCAIIREIAERYGKRVAGWFFDGANRYYDPHYDGTPIVGPNHAPWEGMTQAAKAGNPERIVCYNPWILPELTEFQDYCCGEGYRQHGELPLGGNGIFDRDHPQGGLQAHTNFPLESRWGHVDPDTPIALPRYSADGLISMIQDGMARRNVLTVNLETYEDGGISPASFEMMRAVRRAVRCSEQLA